MKAVIVKSPGGADQLSLSDWETPKPSPHEILIEVKATALNRADILQREGKYPPPEGASTILGLEVSGMVAEVGSGVQRWKTGDEVFGLLPGGGYAQYALMHEEMAMSKPSNLTFEESAAIPEVFLTAYLSLRWLAHLKMGESVLLHAGASGVGTAAIQLAKEMEAAQILVTASLAKHATCLDLGADKAIDYKSQDFKEEVLQHTHQQGVDVIVDFIAAPYLNQNIDCLKQDGRLILLALLGGVKANNVNLAKVLQKRLQIIGSTLRSRSVDFQIELTKDFWGFAQKKFASQQLKPVVDRIFNWKNVQEAHQYMESNQNTGKIVMVVQ